MAGGEVGELVALCRRRQEKALGAAAGCMPFAARLLIGSALSGLVLGGAARAIMRLVALEAGLRPGFSLGGSLEVVAFGTIVGVPLALLFLLLRPRLPLPAPWAGALFGLALFGVFAAFPPPAARSALSGTPDTPAMTALLFALLFVAWGLGLELLDRRAVRRPR